MAVRTPVNTRLRITYQGGLSNMNITDIRTDVTATQVETLASAVGLVQTDWAHNLFVITETELTNA
jgi:hypothetical protein